MAGRFRSGPRRKTGKRRLRRRTILMRASVVATAAFIAFLYYQPLATYVRTRATLNERTTEVEQLRAERARLQARLARSATLEALAREARRMNLVRPGEQLFIVKGVQEWRRSRRGQEGGGATAR